MPKPTKGKRLGGSSSHEYQIISNLISALIEYEKIETTVTKAKTVKPYAEKVITKAKSGTLHDRRQVLKMIQNGIKMIANQRKLLFPEIVHVRRFQEHAPKIIHAPRSLAPGAARPPPLFLGL